MMHDFKMHSWFLKSSTVWSCLAFFNIMNKRLSWLHPDVYRSLQVKLVQHIKEEFDYSNIFTISMVH